MGKDNALIERKTLEVTLIIQQIDAFIMEGI